MLRVGRNLTLLFFLNLSVALNANAMGRLLPLFIKSLGATVFEISLVLSMGRLFSTVLMMPSGLLSDRYGHKKIIALSIFLAGLSVFFYNFATSWEQVIPWTTLFMGSSSVFITPSMALVAESTKPETRATVYGVMYVAWPLGGIIGPVIAGVLADYYGWGYLFYFVAFTSLLSLIPVFLLEERRKRDIERAGEKSRGAQGKFFDRKILPLLVVFSLFHILGTAGRGILDLILPIYLAESFQVSKTEMGLFFSMGFGVAALIAQVSSGVLADKYGRKKVIAYFISATPLLSLLWPWLNSYLLLVGLCMLINGLWSAAWPASAAYLMDLTPSPKRGFTMGIRQTALRLGSTIGPLVGGYLWEAYDPAVPFYASAVFFAASFLLVFFLKE